MDKPSVEGKPQFAVKKRILYRKLKTKNGVEHTRIADEYCGGAAVTKFPTKYLRIELFVGSLLCE